MMTWGTLKKFKAGKTFIIEVTKFWITVHKYHALDCDLFSWLVTNLLEKLILP